MTERCYYLQGQKHFGNRGCEALTRTTAALLRRESGASRVIVPTVNEAHDRALWVRPDPSVRFARADILPHPRLRLWKRAVRWAPFLTSSAPRFYIPHRVRRDILASDAVLLTGGDTITPDNGMASLVRQVHCADIALHAGIPVVLWAASIGPFEPNPALESYVRRFLQRLSGITVRETMSLAYLDRLGIRGNVALATDPAFLLRAEAPPTAVSVPESDAGVMGLNLSSFAVANRGRRVALTEAVRGFLRAAVGELGLSVLLVPHVEPLANPEQSDRRLLSSIAAGLPELKGRVALLPEGLNAAQLKYCIARCRFFIGARTHSTIASLSSGVPTVSIAYSTKAWGINKDLFGHTRYVISRDALSESALRSALARLLQEEARIRHHLDKVLPLWRSRALESPRLLNDVLR